MVIWFQFFPKPYHYRLLLGKALCVLLPIAEPRWLFSTAIWLDVIWACKRNMKVLLHMNWNLIYLIETRKLLQIAASRKGYEALEEWIRPCLKHFHWSAISTPDGNGEVILAKFHSFLQHVVNEHDHLDNALFNKCAHSETIPQRKWLDKGLESPLSQITLELGTLCMISYRNLKG